MSTSLIIPTYNRRPLWENGVVWRSVLSLKPCPDEVLICDDVSETRATTEKETRAALEADDYQNCSPDYLHDLNAMHAAENACLNVPGLATKYQRELGVIMQAMYPSHLCWQPWRATAAQRAEALLRTIGKWRED